MFAAFNYGFPNNLPWELPLKIIYSDYTLKSSGYNCTIRNIPYGARAGCIIQAKSKKLHTAAEHQRWKDSSVLLIAWTILEAGQFTATQGDVIAAKSTMAIMLLCLFFNLPH